MKKLKLNFLYQKASFKPHARGKNEDPIPNHLARHFHQQRPLEAIVTDLTYVRIGSVGLMFVSLLISLIAKSLAHLLVGTRQHML